MSERLIPISKKQHDYLTQLTAGMESAREKIATAASVILMGLDDELGPVGVLGARCTEGVYSLAVEIADAPAVAPADLHTPAESHEV